MHTYIIHIECIYMHAYIHVHIYLFPKLLEWSRSRTSLSPPDGPCSTPGSSEIRSPVAGLLKGPVSGDTCREPSDLILSKLKEPQNLEASEEGGAPGDGDQDGAGPGRLGGSNNQAFRTTHLAAENTQVCVRNDSPRCPPW